MTKLEMYEFDLQKLSEVKNLYSTLQSGLQNGYWKEEFDKLIDGYIKGLEYGIKHEIAIKNANKNGYLIDEKCISCGENIEESNLKVCDKCTNKYEF